ncbi:putative colanic acid biosynthesis acetyltransferase [Wenyingzhuangia sp. 1_MG-2023]|nr:putative colanic acid biosynthesis acetyltransferase [Wenyingzhuangia sp. 1_MG-2023]
MNESKIDLSKYSHSFSLKNKLGRAAWAICYLILFRPFNAGFFRRWRNFLLKFFGASLHSKTNIYATAKIWAPWNLEMGAYATLGPEVDCYNQGKIKIGDHTTISQKVYLCASSHDFTDVKNNLILKPVFIEDQVWIAADAFIGPGVTISQGAVIGARAAVFKDVEAWSVVGGNPAKFIKKRVLKS